VIDKNRSGIFLDRIGELYPLSDLCDTAASSRQSPSLSVARQISTHVSMVTACWAYRTKKRITHYSELSAHTYPAFSYSWRQQSKQAYKQIYLETAPKALDLIPNGPVDFPYHKKTA